MNDQNKTEEVKSDVRRDNAAHRDKAKREKREALQSDHEAEARRMRAKQQEYQKELVQKRFGPYRPPTQETIPKYKAIQEKTKELAMLIHELCPLSHEKATALTMLQQVKMGANAAIAIYSK